MTFVLYDKKCQNCFKRGTMGMNNVEIGLRIQEVRKEQNMTREELAEKAEISTKFLYEIEIGKKGLSAESVLKISRALSISSDYLLTGEGKSKSKYSKFDNLSQKQLKRLEKIVKLTYEFCNDK